MPGWRCVVGRIEDPETGVSIELDAMEVPVVDSTAFNGALVGENALVSDKALAEEIHSRGVFAAMPLFYKYVDAVWKDIIHGVSKNTPQEGRALDLASAGMYLLIMSVMKEALDTGVGTGADVWLLLAIFEQRMDDMGTEYTTATDLRAASTRTKWGKIKNSLWSIMSGRDVAKACKSMTMMI